MLLPDTKYTFRLNRIAGGCSARFEKPGETKEMF